jgi:hypothetical protein
LVEQKQSRPFEDNIDGTYAAKLLRKPSA